MIIGVTFNYLTFPLLKNNVLKIAAHNISSNSMSPTLLIGDYLIVDIKYFSSNKPCRADLAVFKFPLDPSKDYIKRVIGLPGERVQIINKKVYINDQLYETPQAR